MVSNNKTTAGGFSLVELLVVAAVMLMVFGAIFAGFRYTLDLITQSRAKLSALTLANERMEYVHSLSYDAVGTLSGIPSGSIAQTSTTSLNGIIFTETVLIDYVDDAADGTSTADANGIITDYKRAKVTEGWTTRGVYHEVFLVSNIIPRSIETNVGGGTLRVNVFDSAIQPLPGADVRVWNTTGTSTIDVTRSTDATGVALFSGAPANSGYQISVTAPGYSTDKTYLATTSLPNPTTQPVTVRAADISTMNFFIDRVSSLSITALLSKVSSSTQFLFPDLSQVASSTNVTAVSNALALTSSAGIYSVSGEAYLSAVTPSTLSAWDTVTVVATTTAATGYKVYFYTGTSTFTLIPNSDLPSNNNGFSGSTIDISRLDPVAYPSITPQIRLTTSNTAQTPTVSTVRVNYIASKTPAVGASLSVQGLKTIGTLADSSPVYKYTATKTTNSSGVAMITGLEWDAYIVTPSGYDIAEACPELPISIAPGASSTLELVLATNSAHTLRVMVKTVGGVAIAGATVDLRRSGYHDTVTTGTCGQAFFTGLSSASDYDIDVAATGYTTQSLTDVTITGDVVQIVTF